MKSIFFLLIAIFTVSAQVQREAPPSLDGYLSSVDTGIESIQSVEAPRMEGNLQGIVDNTATVRTSESIVEEVQGNQSKLTYLYKKASIGGKEISRYYDLTLTINSAGDVEKMSIKGVSDKEFLFDMEAIVRTWSFSKVKEAKSKTVNLKHLDFLYRRELVVE